MCAIGNGRAPSQFVLHEVRQRCACGGGVLPVVWQYDWRRRNGAAVCDGVAIGIADDVADRVQRSRLWGDDPDTAVLRARRRFGETGFCR